MHRAVLFVAVVTSATAATASETIIYSFDELGRLVATTTTPTSTVNANVTMTTAYDAAGNRTTYAVTGSTNMAAIEAAGAVAIASVQTSGLGGPLGDSSAWRARTFQPNAESVEAGQAGSPNDAYTASSTPF